MALKPSAQPATPTQIALFEAALALLTHHRTESLSAYLSPLPEKTQRPRFDAANTLHQLEVLLGKSFNPLAPVVQSGLPFVPALLRHGAIPDPGFLMAWTQRHGVDTVFVVPDAEAGVMETWMAQRVLPNLEKDYPDDDVGEIAAWLGENAPHEVSAAWPVNAWSERIRASKRANEFTPLLKTLDRLAPATTDPRRPMARWKDSEHPENPHRAAVGLSGRERCLVQLQQLSSRTPQWAKKTLADPNLPYRLDAIKPTTLRRYELVRGFLASQDNLDLDRARLWGLADEKFAVVDALTWSLDNLSRKPDAKSQAAFQRGLALLAARDALGRGLIGFLSCSRENRHEAAPLHRRMAGWGVARPTLDEDILATDGAGLAEQELRGRMAAQQVAQARDAFDGRNAKTVMTCGVEAILGRPERHRELTDLLVDACAGAISFPVEKVGLLLREHLADPDERDRLDQALLLRRFLHFAEKASGPNPRKGDSALQIAWHHYAARRRETALTETFVEHVGRCGLLLDLTPDDWRQLGLMGREALRHKVAHARPDPRLTEGAVRLELDAMDRIMPVALAAKKINGVVAAAEYRTRPRL